MCVNVNSLAFGNVRVSNARLPVKKRILPVTKDYMAFSVAEAVVKQAMTTWPLIVNLCLIY